MSSSTRATSQQQQQQLRPRRGIFIVAPLLLAAAVLFASPRTASAACPFAGRAASSSSPPQHEENAAEAAAEAASRQEHLAAASRALLETDMTSRLGLFAAVEERVFSSASSKPSSPPPSESASPTLSSLAERLESNSDDGEGAASSSSSSSFHLRRRSRRRRSRALSGLVNVSSIISEDDIILPDSALVAKILSKNATVEKNLVAGLANLTRRGALKDMIVEEFRALRKTPQWALNSAGETINATKAAFAYPSTAKLQGANSALAQQQKETVARAVFRVLLPARDVSLAVRAAFHDAGVYNPNAVPPTSKGGANGSLRKELAWPSNAGIVAIWPFISMGHKILNAKFGNGSFSWADSIALAGAAGVEKAGGPTITIGLGRPDAATADPKVGLATDPLAGINLTGDEAVAAWADAGQTPETLATLMGAHTMGRSALTPLEGPLGPPSFTNYFYKASLAQKCSFAVDNALATQPQTATFVEAYAADEALFFSQFARHYRAMTWWGVQNPPPGVDVWGG